MTGRSHEFEPEADSIVYIDFEEDVPEQFEDRLNWMVEAVVDVFNAVGVTFYEPNIRTEFALRGEELTWQWVERIVNERGLDTYNSDTRFEVFPAGTPVFEDYGDPYHPEHDFI